MKKTKKEVEAQEQAIVKDVKDIEMTKVDNLEQIVENAEKQMQLIKRIKELSIKLTNEDDWVDESGQPYLEISGATKIRTFFGINIKDVSYETLRLNDKKGEYILIIAKGVASWRGNEVAEVGTASTRDQFFAKSKGVEKPLEEIDLNDIIKKAVTNLHNRLIKKILGLYFSWDDLRNAGLNIEKIKKVEYKKEDEPTDEEKMKQKEIELMLKEIYGEIPEENYKAILRKLTEFNGKTKFIHGVENVDELTGRRLEFCFEKIKKWYNEEIKRRKEIEEAKQKIQQQKPQQEEKLL